MKQIIGVLLVACSVACCTKERSEEEEILAAAKREAAATCEGPKKHGCEFSVSRVGDGWSVMVVPIILSDNGERVYIPGVFHTYSYNKEGHLVATTPGI
jgi:hypothetical protein